MLESDTIYLFNTKMTVENTTLCKFKKFKSNGKELNDF